MNNYTDIELFGKKILELVECEKFLTFLLMNMPNEEIDEYEKRYLAEWKEE